MISDFTGGGFGAKYGIGNFGLLAIHLSRKAGAPVRLMLDRREGHVNAAVLRLGFCVLRLFLFDFFPMVFLIPPRVTRDRAEPEAPGLRIGRISKVVCREYGQPSGSGMNVPASGRLVFLASAKSLGKSLGIQ